MSISKPLKRMTLTVLKYKNPYLNTSAIVSSSGETSRALLRSETASLKSMTKHIFRTYLHYIHTYIDKESQETSTSNRGTHFKLAKISVSLTPSV